MFSLPRTAIVMVASLIPFGLLVFGPDCSSWTVISRGSSWRSVVNPRGRGGLAWIQGADLMISRWLGCTCLMNLFNGAYTLFCFKIAKRNPPLPPPGGGGFLFAIFPGFAKLVNQKIAPHFDTFTCIYIYMGMSQNRGARNSVFYLKSTRFGAPI